MRVYCIDRFDYLEHSGVKGMRWGHRKDGRSRGATNNKRAETIKKKVSKGRTAVMEALGLKKKPVPPPSSSDLNKKDIIRNGDVKAAYAKRHEFTDNELQSVINRYKKEQELKTLVGNSTRDRVDALAKNMDTATKLIKNTSNAYNATARVVNAFTERDLPIISIGSGDDRHRRDEVRAAKKEREEAKKQSNEGAQSSGGAKGVRAKKWIYKARPAKGVRAKKVRTKRERRKRPFEPYQPKARRWEGPLPHFGDNSSMRNEGWGARKISSLPSSSEVLMLPPPKKKN